MTTNSSTRRWRAALAALPLLAVAACGSSSGGTDDPALSNVPQPGTSGASATAGAFPVTVASGPLSKPTQLTIDKRPTKIVSLSASATETLFAIGAGSQVVAVDDQSDYPKTAPKTKLSGYQPNVEAILGYSPDLVVAADDAAGMVAGLKHAGVPTLLMPAPVKLDEAWSQMERLGAATGHVADAAAVVADTKRRLDAAVAKGKGKISGLTYYHELDPGLYTLTDQTFIGQIYQAFGFKSIADGAKGGDGYPQVSAEFIVSANPDLIVLTDAEFGNVTVASASKRPGWAGLNAVKNHHIIDADPDISSRWGPRIADFAELIGQQAAALANDTAGAK